MPPSDGLVTQKVIGCVEGGRVRRHASCVAYLLLCTEFKHVEVSSCVRNAKRDGGALGLVAFTGLTGNESTVLLMLL